MSGTPSGDASEASEPLAAPGAMEAPALSAALAGFHPAVARWFASRFTAPTAPQERGWPAIRSGQDTLIAAPTGSGKTLAAFLACLDDLVRQALAGNLKDETRVVYVSPLKALSNDVQKNLQEPLREISGLLRDTGTPIPEIRVLVRTGDTPSSQRQSMARKPPHILVTTPESLYILLTSGKGRAMLRTARTVIVDEVHAVARDKRGSHLALSLERLEALAQQRPVRIGLSATQRPIEEIARLLVGAARVGADGRPRCAIIDEGHRRRLDLAVELPDSPLSAVCSNETWEQVYNRIAGLISQHRTTLVFVNTRRLAERLAMHLSNRLGKDKITAHHGSLSRSHRLKAEERLKAGQLQALVATASLELGIDIGWVDLVCQVGSTRSIATLLQRVGRSGHVPSTSSGQAPLARSPFDKLRVSGKESARGEPVEPPAQSSTGLERPLGATPKGRLFPLTRDDLVEGAALVWSARRGLLDSTAISEKPLDILAQQIVAAVSAEEWGEEELFDLCRRAHPYRDLARDEFDQVVHMLADGFSTRRGRSGAYIHYDAVNGRLRARRGARLAAVTSGGAIPETADYQVLLEPEGTVVGSVNEDFAVESLAGDVFQLGNASWRILGVGRGQVRVEDARGAPPSIPFWLGEAPARTAELSAEVSRLRQEVEDRLDDGSAAAWLMEEAALSRMASEQVVEYLAASRKALGMLPTQQTLVLERFFDETGGMQLVLHAPYGGRVNRAWGLALRKRFCRMFNSELQAAATENAIALSLGPQHSFPLEEVFSYVSSSTARDVLVQALLAAPMFTTRWRWNVTRALAVLRQQSGKRVPAPLQRMRSDDLLAAVFPAQVACRENAPGDIDLPDHPLVRETVENCLREAMDIDGFLALLHAMEAGRLRLVALDTVEPSPLAHEVLNAKPYAFLDDAPLEERRTQAVLMRRTLDYTTGEAQRLGALDPEAIAQVQEQAWPQVENPDELHDALLVLGYLTEGEGAPWAHHFDALMVEGRAARLRVPEGPCLWVAAERLPLLQALFPEGVVQPSIRAPERERARAWVRENALRELVRGRLEGLGPVTAEAVASSLGVAVSETLSALAALEGEGVVLRGRFTPGTAEVQWCDRRLLARIHRYTLDRLRQEIEPVSATDFLRFLFAWQHLDPAHRLQGPGGLVAVLGQLQGYEVPAAAWESHILPARLVRYSPLWLDQLCLSGELSWGRLSPPGGPNGHRAGPTRSSPIAFFFRSELPGWLALAPRRDLQEVPLSGTARAILDHLQRQGACFLQELVKGTRSLPSEVEQAVGELVFWGIATCDGFGGLRSLLAPARRRHRSGQALRLRSGQARSWHGAGAAPPSDGRAAGRWSLLRREIPPASGESEADEGVELVARQVLRRYGVVFHRLLQRESGLPPWWQLLKVYRRLEARGEIRGGRFVAGFSGEQYALPQAVEQLRAVRRKTPSGAVLVVSGVDPLNLVGIVTPGSRVPATPSNRIVYRDGVPLAVRAGGTFTYLQEEQPPLPPEAQLALRR